MKILVLNCGSSSLKYQVIEMNTEKTLVEGICDRIGMENSTITFKKSDDKITKELRFSNHKDAITEVLSLIKDEKIGIIKDLSEIDAIGHRVVHGGEIFKESAVIDDKVIEQIDECSEFAPLHNPAGIIGIEACKKVMPGKPMVGVFDTAFHQTMPKERYIYPIRNKILDSQEIAYIWNLYFSIYQYQNSAMFLNLHLVSIWISGFHCTMH
mgnify:CR=1 FL=1